MEIKLTLPINTARKFPPPLSDQDLDYSEKMRPPVTAHRAAQFSRISIFSNTAKTFHLCTDIVDPQMRVLCGSDFHSTCRMMCALCVLEPIGASASNTYWAFGALGAGFATASCIRRCFSSLYTVSTKIGRAS